jgi:general secretion pathway protein B
MSYILDALKKSDQERQRGTVPNVHSVQVPLTSELRRRSWWLYAVASALLLNAGLLVWWLRPWKSEIPNSVAPKETSQQTTEPHKGLARDLVDARQAVSLQAPQASKQDMQELQGAPPQPPAGARHPSPAKSPPSVEVARVNRQELGKSDAPAAGVANKTALGGAVKATRENAGARPRKETATEPSAADLGRQVSSTVQRVEANPPKAPEVVPVPTPSVGVVPDQQTLAKGQALDRQTKTLAQQTPPPEAREAQERLRTAVNQQRASLASGRADRPGPSSEHVQAEQGVPDLRELPLPVQKGLPSLSFSMLVYSDKPTDRMININGRMMHEGQEVSPGLKLEAITPNGAILNFQGHRFRKGVL